MNVVFMLISTILVWLMVPGIAVFYSGFVPHKDVTRILFDSFLMFGLAGILWITIGFPAVFEGDHFGIIGNFHHLFLSGIDLLSTYGTTKLPTSVYLLFQMMFAILTPALFLGAVASRVKIRFIILFVALWSLLIYYPLAHIVWSSSGFLAKMGVLDFAGGTVIHINAGITALILAITLREPYKYNNEQANGNPLWILMGTVLLWLGWYGFNAGSALNVSFQTINAFFTTTVAACASLITWIVLEQFFKSKVTLSGICTGSICGLVGITPGTGYVTVFGSVIIGVISAVGSYYFMNYLKYQLHLNDYLDIFGCHGVSGIIGSICVGLFATKSVNSSVITNGLFYGGGLKQLGLQLFGVIFTIVFVSIVGIVIVQGLKKVLKDDVGIRELELA
ncbi:ammonium transporter [Companilactobacillus heilongjiangensis]|uniref:Ammonium transporter n=1 Tax=Companilactobacillus heilongjiangensis TaxID=1074467 RepID=A0A0K2LFC7_9LACO|nr:ammonium transporter [Companilactobacillus heilongjiangensis]ALB30006.1 ammonia permease [Companilactobacillus heilongjiangensis]